jgi:hypothetical protein
MLESHLDRSAREHHTVASGIGDVGDGVEDAEHSPPAGHRVLRLVEHLSADLDGTDEERDEEQERNQLAHSQITAHTQKDADDDHRRVGQTGDDLSKGERDGD